MAPENDSAPSGSDAPAVDEASAPEGFDVAESTGAGTNDPAAIAGADPAGAAIPPQGVDLEAEAAAKAAEEQEAERVAEAARVEAAAAAEQEAARVAAEEAARIAEAEAAEASPGEPINPDPDPDPEDQGHPEPSPVGVGIVQDNVTEPGVEHTGTRAGTSSHSTEHEGVPQSDEEIAAHRDRIIAEGEERDRLAGEGAPVQ